MKPLLKKGLLGIILSAVLLVVLSASVSAYSVVNIVDTELDITTADSVIPVKINYMNDDVLDVYISARLGASLINDYTEGVVSISGETILSAEDTLYFPVYDDLSVGKYTVYLTVYGPALDAVYVEGSVVNYISTPIPFTVTVGEAIPDKDTEIASGLITEIDVDEDEVAPGETVQYEITLETAEGERYEDVKIVSWLEDVYGERLTEKQETSTFNIGKTNDDDEEVRTIYIDVPEDADEEEYFLVVRAEGTMIENSVGIKGLLDSDSNERIDVVRNDHSFKVEHVYMPSVVAAGSSFDVGITVLNNGNSDEDNVAIRIAIPELGISQTSQSLRIEENEKITNYFTLSIPGSAVEEDYTVLVSVYNSKYTEIQQYELTVEGTTSATESVTEIVVSTADSSKNVGKYGAVYTVSITNIGQQTKTFTLETSGVRDWAQTSVNPATVVIPSGATKVVSIFVAPNEDAQGTKQFTVFVKEGSRIVDSIALSAETDGGNATVLATSILKWGIGFLILVLVVVFVVWSWRREIAGSKKKTGRKYY